MLFGRWVRPAFRCRECERVACGGCRRELRTLDVCERCLFIQIKGGFVDSRDKWIREREIREGAEGRIDRARWATFVLPGFGHLLQGDAIKGAAFLTAFTLLSTYLVAGPLLLPDPGLVGWPALPTAIPSALILGVVYVVAVLDTRSQWWGQS